MAETTYPATIVEVNNDKLCNSIRETATAALAVSICCLILCIIMMVVLYVRFRRMAEEQTKQIADLKRLANDQEYYIDNLSRKLNQEIQRVHDVMTRLVKPDEFRELKSKALQHEQILEEVCTSVSEDMNPDIFLMSLKLKDFEEKYLDLEKRLEILQFENNLAKEMAEKIEKYLNPFRKFTQKCKSKSTECRVKLTQSFKDKPKYSVKDKGGYNSIQNNRLFEEIMKYRGKIVHLEKKDEEKRRKLLSLEEKLGALMEILNINIVEKDIEQSTSADSGATICYKTLQSRSPAVYKTFKNVSGDESQDDVYQETSIDVLCSPTITFQLPPTMYSMSSPSNSDDQSISTVDREESVA